MAHEMIQSEFVKITPAMIQSWEVLMAQLYRHDWPCW